MVDSLEALQKLQQERQKFLEQKMVEEAEKQLQAERDDALKQLGEEQLESMNNLIISLDLLNQTIRNTPPAPPDTGTGGGGGGGGGGRPGELAFVAN
jgi:hypothetical protein